MAGRRGLRARIALNLAAAVSLTFALVVLPLFVVEDAAVAAAARVERAGGGQADRREVLRRAQELTLAILAIDALLVVLAGTVLLGRAFGRRLGELDDAMARVERLELEAPLLASEEGDEIGRMGGTLRRMAERLRDDKRRTQAYIEELERTNRALQETREGLVRTEKLATVGRLAAGVAHEIGNPVAAILGYLDVMRLTKEVSSKEYMERIEREARRVDRIVRDLLEFARPRALQVGPVSLQAVVGAAARLVEPQPRWRGVQLVQSVPADLPLVDAQEHYATQVLVNLLINAADACAGRGTVQVTGRVVDGGVELVVADDGPGIAPALRGRLFEPFFTTKAPGEGTGLGLAICLRLMEQFGGGVRVEDVQPHGAAFVLRFARASA